MQPHYRERTRQPKFKCCTKHKHNGNGNRNKLQCDGCDSLYDERCLAKHYRIYATDISRNWKCPDCVAREYLSDEDRPISNRYNKNKKSNKYNKKKHQRKKHKNVHCDFSEEDIIDELSIDSTESETTKDNSNKKITKQIKKRIQKKKSIQNRLNNINPKYKLKYHESMLELSSSGTDVDFDAGTWYPLRMPDTDKQLENKRKKQCKKNHQKYSPAAKTSKFRTFEKVSVIKVIEDVAENPEKYNYNPKYGWSATDIATITSKYLYEIRRKNAEEHKAIPLRSCASIKGLFKRWDDTKNKESEDKEYISKYESARNKLTKAAKKACSDVNEELLEFGQQYAVTKLENAQKKIKKLTKQCDVTSDIKGAVADVRGLINELKNDKKDAKSDTDMKNDEQEPPKHDIDPIGASNPYLDSDLLHNNDAYTPENNKIFVDKYNHKANVGEEITGTVKESYDQNACDCSDFLTQMNNQKKGPFDEENNITSNNLVTCERALWDDEKAYKLGIKFDSLRKVVPNLSNEQILSQLANTVQFL